MGKTTQPVDIYNFRPATGQTDQALTVDDTEGGVQLTAYPDTVTHVFITVETAGCRFTLDGSAPTATNGHPLTATDVCMWPASWARAAKFIRTTTTSAALHCSPLTASGT